jgi:hypothetical protein
LKPQPSKTNGREKGGVLHLYLSAAIALAAGLVIHSLYCQVGWVITLAVVILLFELIDRVVLWAVRRSGNGRKEREPTNVISPNWGLDDDKEA